MPNKNNLIEITVSRSGSTWTFSGAENADAKGNLAVGGNGAHQIEFRRKSGETWRFVEPFILFGQAGAAKNEASVAGVLTVVSPPGPSAIDIVDTNNQALYTSAFYEYSLFTNLGVIDPMIVNDGGP
jgi:hypothetical protein